MTDDWITAGIGAWLGNRRFRAWFKRHPSAAWIFFVCGTVAAISVLIVLQ
ncbi:MAG: hypothetical protein PGN16_16260 [Sphingomonas phyllosphaerae]